MSWFSELADKAENLLNKIDQNAAAVLQEKPKSPNQILNVKNHETSLTSTSTTFTPIKIENNSVEKKPRKIKPVNKKILKPYTNEPQNKTNMNDDNSNSSMETKMLIEETDNTIEVKNISNINESVNSCSNESPERILNSDTTNKNNQELFDIENAMLKNEISVVHNELSILLSKVKSSERITEDTESRLSQMERSYNDLIKENANLHTKILSYEKKFQESDFNFSNDQQNANQLLHEKVNNLESKLQSSTAINIDLTNKLKESRNKCFEFEEKLEKAKSENNSILEEWKNYKIRANNTLNMKEKIIETLGGNQINGECDATVTFNMQIDQLKLERDQAIEELSQLRSEYNLKLKENDNFEVNVRSCERQICDLRDMLRQEKSLRDIAEQTVNSLSKEMQTLQMETAKQISSLRVKLHENKSKENEMNTSFNSAESGEERFRSLTQALVAKQAALESVTADRNALRLQLEKTENKYRSDLVSMRNNRPRIIDFNYTDDAKERFPSLLQESPWDSGISRRVKKAYSSLDSCSVRMGVFLRRNPIARIFIIAYMVFLHLWVLIVLCTYTPEAHNK